MYLNLKIKVMLQLFMKLMTFNKNQINNQLSTVCPIKLTKISHLKKLMEHNQCCSTNEIYAPHERSQLFLDRSTDEMYFRQHTPFNPLYKRQFETFFVLF